MPEGPPFNKTLSIIGEEDVVVGFRALGFRAYPVSDLKGARALLDEIVQEKYAVCLVQENIYLAAQEEIARYKNLPLPVFIPFNKTGQLDSLERIVKDIRLRATGTN